MSTATNTFYQTVIIGGGPAGTGPLIYGGWSGRLNEWLTEGIALVEQGNHLCVGNLHEYQITSNTISRDFIDFLNHEEAGNIFPLALKSELYQTLLHHHEEVMPLPLIGEFLKIAGNDLANAFHAYPQSNLFLGWTTTKIKKMLNDQFEVQLTNASGETQILFAKQVLLATGGEPAAYKHLGQLTHQLSQQSGADTTPLIMSSADLLTENGLQIAEMWLNNYDDPEVVIIGGSHSAFSCAQLLGQLNDSDFRPKNGQIKIVHRSSIKVFYDSAEQARHDGFMDFKEQDICTKSGNVFYLAGLRGDAKQLYRSVAGIDRENPNFSISLIQHPVIETALINERINWENVALVIFAGGYDFREIKIENPMGMAIPLQGTHTGRYVNQKFQLLDFIGNPIDGLFAVGLGTGFSLTKFGNGELSFKGQENSVWLCQHDMGESLFNELMG